MAREHCDYYLYYIRYKTLEITSSQTTFQLIIFNPVKGISPGTFYRTIHPQNITLSIQDVFLYIQKLIEFNENQDTPLYRPSHLEEFFRFNYQLLWEQKDQQAYINIPQILTPTELFHTS